MAASTHARIPIWVAIVVVISALLSLTGAALSKLDPALLTNGGAATQAMRVFTDYTFSRDLALAVMLLALLVLRARTMLAAILTLTAVTQLFDVLDDLGRGDFILAPGLFIFGVICLICAWRLIGWRASPTEKKQIA